MSQAGRITGKDEHKGTNTMSKRVRFFTPNDPHQMRIYPELAEEIGFNESILLLQLEYLIGISKTEEHDGDLWTYQTLEDLRDNNFPWWSIATISRIIKSLQELNLIKIGNYNKISFDRTQWFAINWEGCRKLKSIKIDDAIFQDEKSKRTKRKMEPGNLQNPSSQNGTTIPENPTENPTQTTVKSKDSGADAPPPPPNPTDQFITEILAGWKECFPKKSQPKPSTFRSNITARMKNPDFAEKWLAALRKASKSPTLQNESWFDFEFFVKNDKHYLKMLDGWMDWKDREQYGAGPANGSGRITQQPQEDFKDIYYRNRAAKQQQGAANGN
jgi:hypothetical protein